MKVIINEKLVKRQATIGKGASLIGMGALLAGLVVSYRWPNLLTVSFGCLIVGFLLSQICRVCHSTSAPRERRRRGKGA